VFEVGFGGNFKVGDEIGLAFELVADFLNAGGNPSEGGLEPVVDRDDIKR